MTTSATLPAVLAAVAIAILAAAGTVVNSMTARVRRMQTAAEKLAAYRVAVIVGAALRESAGVIGLFATFVTGNLLWVGLLAAMAALAILTNVPTRPALRSALQENAPIG